MSQRPTIAGMLAKLGPDALFYIADFCTADSLKALPCTSKVIARALASSREELWQQQVQRVWHVGLSASRVIDTLGGIAVPVWAPEPQRRVAAPDGYASWLAVYDAVTADSPGMTTAYWPCQVLKQRLAWASGLPPLSPGAERHGFDLTFLSQEPGKSPWDIALHPFWFDGVYYTFSLKFELDDDQDDGMLMVDFLCFLSRPLALPEHMHEARGITAAIYIDVGIAQPLSITVDFTDPGTFGFTEAQSLARIFHKQQTDNDPDDAFPRLFTETGLMTMHTCAHGNPHINANFQEICPSLKPLACVLDIAHTTAVLTTRSGTLEPPVYVPCSLQTGRVPPGYLNLGEARVETFDTPVLPDHVHEDGHDARLLYAKLKDLMLRILSTPREDLDASQVDRVLRIMHLPLDGDLESKVNLLKALCQREGWTAHDDHDN